VNLAAVERIARAVLYEGYVLYPYRRSSVKNVQRFTFGGVYPPAWSAAQEGADASEMQTQALVRGGDGARVEARVRFLQLTERREPGAPPWHEAQEREVAPPEAALAALLERPVEEAFALPASRATEAGIERRQDAIEGTVTLAAERVAAGVARITARVRNRTGFDAASSREAALLRTLCATHTILGVRDPADPAAAFVSLLDPPAALRGAAAACRNVGTYPVLVGRDTVLSSPIILYDDPEVAPESPGDLFDATEIDEILTLRILTMTEAEKREARATDPRARALIDRTEALPEADLARLHGRLRVAGGAAPVRGLRRGARVRLRPRARADIFDVALEGMTATIVSVEKDYEGKVHVAVTVDDDPGRDLGAEGRPGHRFFFSPDELEIL
jgi:hypothetical protein